MIIRNIVAAAGVLTLLAGSAPAEEFVVTYKSLSSGACARSGARVPFGLQEAWLPGCHRASSTDLQVTQVMLRDRFAGPHTVSTAQGKAWTAASFRTSTSELNSISQPGMMQAEIVAAFPVPSSSAAV